jgi:RNA polymerase sigma-70 factor (ECF subfamily)
MEAFNLPLLPADDGSANHEGNQNAFWLIWMKHNDILKQRCMGWTSSPADAEDALSIASLRCYEKLPKAAAEIKNIEAWLTTVTYNICMDIHRGYRRESALSIQAPQVETILDKLETQELHGKLGKGIDALPERQRAVLELRLREWSYQEISVHLGISIKSAYKRNSRARNHLRQMLVEDFPSTSIEPKSHSMGRMTTALNEELKTLDRGHKRDHERQPSLPTCPNCRSDVVVRNGSREGRQRYRCKHCRHQFIALSQSMATRRAEKIKISREMTREGKGVKAIARELEVSPKTVRRWIRGQAARPSS